MSKFEEHLNAAKVLIADGATGTNLQKVGLAGGMHAEDWVLDHPEKILDLEKAFVSAGSDIILTCTFGATPLRLKGAKHAGEAALINRRAAELACEAVRGHDVLVGGSMGPLGQLMKPYGPVLPEEARAAFTEQARALASGGIDLFVIETHFAFEEATAALDAVRSVSDLPIVLSFSYDRGTRSMMGAKPADVVKTYRAKGATMVGANCGTTLENMETILGEYAAAEPGFPLWAKPNAGMPRLESGQTIYDVTPNEMASFARRYFDLGARVVGGCCGSTPRHIEAIARELKR